MSERYSANPNIYEASADKPHCTRYFVARGFLRPDDVVVDCACGTGYGSHILSKHCQKVLAIDRLETFEQRWKADNISFMVSNIEELPEYPFCDTWVTLETIEHLKDPTAYMAKVCQATRKTIIVSSPNKPTAGLNEFHLTDVLLTNIQHIMSKFPDWIPYHSLLQGDYYIIIYVRRNTKLVE